MCVRIFIHIKEYSIKLVPVQGLSYEWCQHHVDGSLHLHNGGGPGLRERLLQTPVVCRRVLICVLHGPLIQRGVWCTVIQ